MAEFKKGDIVQSLVNEEVYDIEVGDIGVVDENDSNNPFIIWTKNKEKYALMACDFILVESGPVYNIF